MATQVTQVPLNEAKLNEFMSKAIGDMGGATSASLIAIGEQLGLYKAMGDGKKLTSAELAKKSGTARARRRLGSGDERLADRDWRAPRSLQGNGRREETDIG